MVSPQGDWGVMEGDVGSAAVRGTQLLQRSLSKQVFVANVFQDCPRGGESSMAHHHHHTHTSSPAPPCLQYAWPLLTNPISALNSKAKNSPSNLIMLVVTMFVGGMYVA